MNIGPLGPEAVCGWKIQGGRIKKKVWHRNFKHRAGVVGDSSNTMHVLKGKPEIAPGNPSLLTYNSIRTEQDFKGEKERSGF